MSSTTLTIDRLTISPFNVRTYRPDAEDTHELQASILAEGLHNPIVCHLMRGTKDKWGAVAGGRRYRAIGALVKRGDLPADWPVRVTIVDNTSEAELIEISITENLVRRDLREHELFAGVARAAANGHDVNRIAENLGGQDPALIARWLRLGRLARPVFDALAAGRLDLDQAHAYAATEDQELQEATFARLSAGHGYAHTPSAIRLAMKVGDREAIKLLRFVGEDAYRAAGGRFELDLFAEAEDDRGRIVDEGKLYQLVEAKLNAARDQTRITTARRDLRFVPTPPQSEYGGNDWQLQVEPKRVGTPGSVGALELPEGDIVAHIAIDDGGEPAVSFWWISRKAKFGTRTASSAPLPAAPGNRQTIGSAVGSAALAVDKAAADALVKEEDGLGKDSVQIFSAMRRGILRALLVDDAVNGGSIAQEYLIWAQLRMLQGGGGPAALGIGRLPVESIGGFDLAQRARAQLEASGVARAVSSALRELSAQTFCSEPDLPRAFQHFRAAAPRLKDLAAAVVAGAALERSLATPGYALPIHDELALSTAVGNGESIREHWSPTAELLALHPRVARLKLVEQLVDAATLKRWSALKDADLTDVILAAVTARPDWVHPLLAFREDEGAADAVTDQLEAAE